MPSRRTQSGGFRLIRELVENGHYLLTLKVQELLSQGYFELDDLEHSICHGTLNKTETDELMDSIGNKKYIVVGPDMSGYAFYTVGKIQRQSDSRIYLVITAHEARANYEKE